MSCTLIFLQLQQRDAEAETATNRAREIRRSRRISERGCFVVERSESIGVRFSPPALVQKLEPEYSEEARAAKFQGTVLLYIDVTPEGTAQNIRVARSLGMGLDEKAIEAVKQWKFSPGQDKATAHLDRRPPPSKSTSG